jgi:hypothetical protein
MFVYRSHNFTDGLDCAVCLCELEENEKVRLLPNCRHCFHVDCIDMWFLSHSTCPICRTSAQPEQPVLAHSTCPLCRTRTFAEPVLESARLQQVSVTIQIPGPIASESHDDLNSEQGQAASSEEEYNVQNPTNILSSWKQEQTNTDMDEEPRVEEH